MFLYPKVKLIHQIKTYIIQCQKLVIQRNHLFIFSNKEKKNLGSTSQCLGHWHMLSVSFSSVPGCEPWAHWWPTNLS